MKVVGAHVTETVGEHAGVKQSFQALPLTRGQGDAALSAISERRLEKHRDLGRDSLQVDERIVFVDETHFAPGAREGPPHFSLVSTQTRDDGDAVAERLEEQDLAKQRPRPLRG